MADLALRIANGGARRRRLAALAAFRIQFPNDNLDHDPEASPSAPTFQP
jgi:hypothetical protein